MSKTTINTNGKNTLTGIAWCFFERVGAQGVTFVVSVILARLLTPEVYGTVALLAIFYAFFALFANGGFSTALIQKKDSDDLDFSSVFYFNVVVALCLYCLLFCFAGTFAKHYNDNELIPLIRVYGVLLIIGSFKGVQSAYVSKNLLFKRFFFATLGGTIMAAIVGIHMARLGYGAWALVTQHLINSTIDTLILWCTVPWRPKLIFSFNRLKKLFNFGWKIFVSGILDTVYNKLRALLIGTVYTRQDLAFYHKGISFPSMVVDNINSSINSVLFPSMSNIQDEVDELKKFTRRALMSSTYLIMPCMVGLAVCADSLVRLLLTEKWMSCVFYLRIACFTYAFYPINTTNLCAIKAMGRSDIFLKLEAIKKMVGVILILSTIWVSVKALALSAIISSICSQIVNSYPNKKLLNYSYWEQIKDLFPQILICLLMGCSVYIIQYLPLSSLYILVFQVISGFVVYIGLSKAFHLESCYYVMSNISKLLGKIKTKE